MSGWTWNDSIVLPHNSAIFVIVANRDAHQLSTMHWKVLRCLAYTLHLVLCKFNFFGPLKKSLKDYSRQMRKLWCFGSGNSIRNSLQPGHANLCISETRFKCMCWFVGAFTESQKHPLICHFHPSVCMYQHCSYWTDFCEIWNWNFCENLSRESKFCWSQTKISNILPEDIVCFIVAGNIKFPWNHSVGMKCIKLLG